MRFRTFIILLLCVSACATSAPSPQEPAARDLRLDNLQRAATLPWTDGGRCVVQEASQPWPVLIQIQKQRKAAATCGYNYIVGVSTEAHKDALLREDQSLHVVVTGCKR